MEVQLYTEWADNHVYTSNLLVVREKLSAELSLTREIESLVRRRETHAQCVRGGRYTTK